jgi:hypothetical protein
VVNIRDDLSFGLKSAGLPPVEWQVSDGLVPYEQALAAMDARAAAIADGRAAELVWLLEHPPLYTAGTSANTNDLIEARFPVHETGRGGQFTYHGPGQRVVYLMLDLKRRAPDVRRYVATLEEWLIRTLGAFNVRAGGARTASACGSHGPTRARAAKTRSPPSASGSSAGSACTASRSTSIRISRISPASCRAASPIRAMA